MLYLIKRFDASLANLRRGTFYLPVTDHLEDRTLGLIGLGASGRELARRAHAFGMRCRAVDPVQPGGDVLADLGIEAFGPPQDLDALLADSDFVSLHLPLVEDTYHLIGRRELGLMRPSAYLINVARGPLVDEEALVDALREGRLAGAGLDAFSVEPIDPEGPLLSLPNVVATPHVAGVTSGTSVRRAGAVAENVRRIAAGLAPLYELATPRRRE
jgi:phosphoglycerate dehydrogenase-like enzyme